MFGKKLRRIKKTLETEQAYAERMVKTAEGDNYLKDTMNYWRGRKEAYATLLKFFF